MCLLIDSLDLFPNNILLSVRDDTALLDVKQAEMQSPSTRKVLADRIIHLSYTMAITDGKPVISDFGASRMGEPREKYSGDVMPGVYRAPEIIAGMEWDSKIDMWSIGVMVCWGSTPDTRRARDAAGRRG